MSSTAGRGAKEELCDVDGCNETAERSISQKKFSKCDLEVKSGVLRNVHLCKNHYKQYKKQTKTSREFDQIYRSGMTGVRGDMLDLFFLGTGASVPSRCRALPCVAVRRGRDIVLFDCGEGSQRQIMISPLSFMKIRAILVTHLHGDHFYGLPGLLQTMGLSDRKEPLIVCGPEGFSDALGASLEACEGEIPYPLDMRDVSPGDVVTFGDMRVEVFETSHGIPSLGYVVREPDIVDRVDPEKAKKFNLCSKDIKEIISGGRVRGASYDDIAAPDLKGLSVGYTGDTVPCETLEEGLRGVDAIVTESTYSADDAELAVAHNHSTCADAAGLAARCGARALFLVHVSNRYKEREPLCLQARESFPETHVPEDFDRWEITRRSVRKVDPVR